MTTPKWYSNRDWPSLYTPNLPAQYLALHRAEFHSNLTRGTARPFTIPYTLLGYLLPILYLTIPLTKRPWLRRVRFVVALAVVVLNWHVVRSGTSSASIAVSYATGLVAAWGVIWGVGLVLFAEVQGGAVARARVRRVIGEETAEVTKEVTGKQGDDEGLKGECDGDGSFPGRGKERVMNGACKGHMNEHDGKKKEAPDESETALVEYEHYWQPYPNDAGFFGRLVWVFDLFSSFRGIGWNIAIPSVPHPRGSIHPLSIPLTSPSGFHRSPTYRSFVFNRLFHLTWSYLILDVWTLTARFDPYFVPGPPPAPSHPLPALLASLPPYLLSPLRSAAAGAGVLAALFSYFNAAQLLSILLPGYNPLWQHPSIFGSFSDNILDRGLAGFWGGWWHQSFRLGFTLPTAFLVRTGVLPRGGIMAKTVGMFIAFFLSGVMHAAGGYTSLPTTTDISSPILFFLLQFAGIILQTCLGWLVRRAIGRRKIRIPRGWKRAGNLTFVAAWLHGTNGLLIGDMSRAALWLFEPVPFSPLRALGLGPRGEGAWRWDGEYIPRWYKGRRWWESGIRI